MPRDPRIIPHVDDVLSTDNDFGRYELVVRTIAVEGDTLQVKCNVRFDASITFKNDFTICDWWRFHGVECPQVEILARDTHAGVCGRFLILLPDGKCFVCDSVADIVEKLNIKAE